MTGDTILRVTYGGEVYDLDVNNRTPVRLNISAIENSDIGSTFGVSSQNFELPGTKKNNKFFKHGYIVGVDQVPALYESIPAKVIYNGESLMDGDMQITEIIADEFGYTSYKVTVNNHTVGFKEALTGKFIRDCDWSDYILDYTTDNVIASWSGSVGNGNVYYPLMNLGLDGIQPTGSVPPVYFLSGSYPSTRGRINNQSTPMAVQQFLPAIKAKVVMDKIFDQAGFNYTGSFFSSPEFDNLYVLPKSQDGLGVANISGSNTAVGTGAGYATDLFIPDGPGYDDILPIDYSYNNPGNNFDFANDWYEVPTTGLYDITGGGYLNWESTSTFSARVNIKVYQQKLSGGGPIQIASVNWLKPGINVGDTQLIANTGQVYLNAGDKIYQYCTTIITHPPLDEPYLVLDPELTINSAPLQWEGGSFSIGDQFDAQAKSLDFFKGIIQKFNLVVEPDYTQTKTLKVDPYNYWVYSGRNKDWTSKYDTAKRISIKHPVTEQKQSLKFKDEDDVDIYNKTAIDNFPNIPIGTTIIEATSDLTEGEGNIGSFFSSLVAEGIQVIDPENRATYTTAVAPALYKYENSKQISYKFKPRIGYQVTGYAPYVTWIGTHNVSMYKTFLPVSNIATSQSAALETSTLFDTFNVPSYLQANTVMALANGSGSRGTYEQYWGTYIESLYWDDARKVTMDLYMKPTDFKDIQLNDKIFIKDQQYRINKITGLNLSEPDVVTVELLKAYPKTGNIVIPTPAPTPTPSPTPSPTPTPTASPTPSPTPTPQPCVCMDILITGSGGPEVYAGSIDYNDCFGTRTVSNFTNPGHYWRCVEYISSVPQIFEIVNGSASIYSGYSCISGGSPMCPTGSYVPITPSPTPTPTPAPTTTPSPTPTPTPSPTVAYDYWEADEYICEDCAGGPERNNVLVAVPTGAAIPNRYYLDLDGLFTYKLLIESLDTSPAIIVQATPNLSCVISCGGTPSPTPSPTPTPTPSPTITPTPSPTATPVYSGLIRCSDNNNAFYYLGGLSSGDKVEDGSNVCYVSTGTITDITGKTQVTGTTPSGCSCTPTPAPTPSPTPTPSNDWSCIGGTCTYMGPGAGEYVSEAQCLYFCSAPTPTPTATPTASPTITPTPSPTYTPPVYYYFDATICGTSTAVVVRDVNNEAFGVYNVGGTTCVNVTGNSLGPSFDYDLSTATYVGSCGDASCLSPTPSPTPTPTPSPTEYYTFTNCGRGSSAAAACNDTVNERTFYSDCPTGSFGTGCYVFVDNFGNPLTGYSNVFMNGATWDINSSTGFVITLSSEQC